MRVIDKDTGKEFLLYVDDEFAAKLRTFYEDECKHSKTEVRKVTLANGSTQIKRQCLRCGGSVGTAIKHSEAPGNISSFDGDLKTRYESERSEAREALIQAEVRKQKERNTLFWRDYNSYLQSTAWANKRSQVLSRAKGVCEGCGTNKATQVHHLTYRHVLKEFLFELVAVCDECHARLHSDDGEDDAKADEPHDEEQWFDLPA